MPNGARGGPTTDSPALAKESPAKAGLLAFALPHTLRVGITRSA